MFENLPNELIQNIFSFLTFKERTQITLVSKSFKTNVNNSIHKEITLFLNNNGDRLYWIFLKKSAQEQNLILNICHQQIKALITSGWMLHNCVGNFKDKKKLLSLFSLNELLNFCNEGIRDKTNFPFIFNYIAKQVALERITNLIKKHEGKSFFDKITLLNKPALKNLYELKDYLNNMDITKINKIINIPEDCSNATDLSSKKIDSIFGFSDLHTKMYSGYIFPVTSQLENKYRL